MKTHFSAFSEDHEVRGSTIIGYKTAINNKNFAHFFEARGFKEVDPDQWYPAQNVMDVFNDMLEQSHGLMDFVGIGMATAPHLRLPPTVDRHNADQVLTALSTLPSAMIRSSRPGYLNVERISKTHCRITARSAMPDDMLYGIIYALARDFVQKVSSITLVYPPDGSRRDFRCAQHDV